MEPADPEAWRDTLSTLAAAFRAERAEAKRRLSRPDDWDTLVNCWRALRLILNKIWNVHVVRSEVKDRHLALSGRYTALWCCSNHFEPIITEDALDLFAFSDREPIHFSRLIRPQPSYAAAIEALLGAHCGILATHSVDSMRRPSCQFYENPHPNFPPVIDPENLWFDEAGANEVDRVFESFPEFSARINGRIGHDAMASSTITSADTDSVDQLLYAKAQILQSESVVVTGVFAKWTRRVEDGEARLPLIVGGNIGIVNAKRLRQDAEKFGLDASEFEAAVVTVKRIADRCRHLLPYSGPNDDVQTCLSRLQQASQLLEPVVDEIRSALNADPHEFLNDPGGKLVLDGLIKKCFSVLDTVLSRYAKRLCFLLEGTNATLKTAPARPPKTDGVTVGLRPLYADGTNLPYGTKFFLQSRQISDLIDPTQPTANTRWQRVLERVQERFEELVKRFRPLQATVIQTAVPWPNRELDYPPCMAGTDHYCSGSGLRLDFGLLVDGRGHHMFGEWPFPDIHGEGIVNTAGSPFACRFGMSRQHYITKSLSRSVNECREFPPALDEVCREAGESLLMLPAFVNNTLWRNWLDGFARPGSAGMAYLWLDAVFELAWNDAIRNPHESRYAWRENFSYQLSGSGVFPRIHHAPPEWINTDDGIQTHYGYPFRWYSHIDDIARASIAAIDALLSIEQEQNPGDPIEDEKDVQGVSLFTVALVIENDEVLARATVKRWIDSKKIKAKPIGKDPDDRRAKLYILSEIMADVAKILGLAEREKARYRESLSARLRRPITD